MKELHWLPIAYRINYKLCLMMHTVVNNRSPAYITDTLVPTSSLLHREEVLVCLAIPVLYDFNHIYKRLKSSTFALFSMSEQNIGILQVKMHGKKWWHTNKFNASYTVRKDFVSSIESKTIFSTFWYNNLSVVNVVFLTRLTSSIVVNSNRNTNGQQSNNNTHLVKCFLLILCLVFSIAINNNYNRFSADTVSISC